MDSIFKVDIRKLVLFLLPTAVRKPILYHLLYRMLVPFVTVYRSFYERRLNDNFYARYDSSYGNIQRMLNILFPSENGDEITVTEADTTDVEYNELYITTEIEDDSAIVGFCYIDAPIKQKLFNVTVPEELEGKKNEIEHLVSNYALPGYGFTIE